MNIKQTKRFLQEYKKACMELETLNEEHERIIRSLCSITSDPSRSGGGTMPSDKVGSGVALWIDHCKKVDEEIKYYIAVRDEVRSVVRDVMHHNIVWGQCLHHRYVNGFKPTTVALEMGYDESNERKIHRNALDYASKVIERRGIVQSGPLLPGLSVV